MATNTSSPKRRSTPASMPEAMATGMRPIARSNQPENPQSVMRPPDTRKAPVASSMDRPAALVTSRAAPGVDQAVTTGTR
jgi:hypothetical protein